MHENRRSGVARSGDAMPVDEQRWPITMHFGDLTEVGMSQCKRPPFTGVHCRTTPAAFYYRVVSGAKPSVEHIALFHYATRSRADFDVKQARGMGWKKDWPRSDAWFDRLVRRACARPRP